MLKYLKDLESFKDFKTVVELEENTNKNFLFETIDFDSVVSNFLNLSSNYNYQHGIINSDNELENYLKRVSKGSDTPFITVMRQGQNIRFNEEYYHINGYDNLGNLEVSRLNAEMFDLKQNIVEVLKLDIEEFIQNHFEYSRNNLILNKDRDINFNDVNYSINENDKTIVYGANVSNILEVLTATLSVDIIRDLHKTFKGLNIT